MTDPTTFEAIRIQAVSIAEEAAALIREGWQSRPATTIKASHADLVTEFDKRSEILIVDRLRTAFPDHAIVGEEGSSVAGSKSTEGDSEATATWYVDPLDGTMNFAHGFPWFAVSIGLVMQGHPAVGVVAAPALGWTFSGAVGYGAFRNEEPIKVSGTTEVETALFATGFPHVPGRPDYNLTEWAACVRHTHGPRRLGSAALDLAGVAAGWLDVYFERNIGPWDLAGGAALVLAAGGHVSDFDGGVFDARTGRVAATNGHVHDKAVAFLQQNGTAPI